MDRTEKLHLNAVDYFEHFLDNKISAHISTVAVAEYAAGDDVLNLPLSSLLIESFDFRDGARAGEFHAHLLSVKNTITDYNRKIVANDVKILAQIHNRPIDAIVTADLESLKKYIAPLEKVGLLRQVRFLDLNISVADAQGLLF